MDLPWTYGRLMLEKLSKRVIDALKVAAKPYAVRDSTLKGLLLQKHTRTNAMK